MQLPVALSADDKVFDQAEFDNLTPTGTTSQNVNRDQHAAPHDTSIIEGLLASISSKIKDLFKKNSNLKDNSDARKHPVDSDQQPAIPEVQIMNEKRPCFIPANVELTLYKNDQAVEEELAPASKAYTHTEEVLHGLAKDLRSDKNLDIEEVEVVIQDVVDSKVRNPNALMLIMRLRQQDNVSYGHGLQTAV